MRWTCPYAHPGQKFCSLTTNVGVCVGVCLCVRARVRTLCHGQQLFYKKRIIIFTGYKNFLVGASVVPSDRRPATRLSNGACVCVLVYICMYVNLYMSAWLRGLRHSIWMCCCCSNWTSQWLKWRQQPLLQCATTTTTTGKRTSAATTLSHT